VYLQGITPREEESHTFVLWRNSQAWLKMHIVSNKFTPLWLLIRFRTIQIRTWN
jgi:hypothetical protein